MFKYNKYSDSRKILISNFSYLSILEITGLIFPILTYPYLIRVLGGELYGNIIYAQVLLSYVIITTNYGFSISAIRDISENRNDTSKVNTVFSSVIYLKSLICIICLIVCFAVVYIFNLDHKLIYFLSIGTCIQEIFFPIWIFQGMEKMRYITIISFLSRLSFVVLIFIFVKHMEDYWLVPLFYSFGGILTSILSIIIVRSKFHVSFISVSLSDLKNTFNQSTPFFASRIAVVIMERTNVILLGAFMGYSSVAVYDLAIKVISIVKIPISIVSQVLYPYTAKSRNFTIITKIYSFMLVGTLFVSIMLYICAPYIVDILGGEKLFEAIGVLQITGWIMPALGVSTVLGASTLVAAGYATKYNKSVLYGFVVYVIMTIFAVVFREVTLTFMAVSFIVPECVIALYRRYITKKYNIVKIL